MAGAVLESKEAWVPACAGTTEFFELALADWLAVSPFESLALARVVAAFWLERRAKWRSTPDCAKRIALIQIRNRISNNMAMLSLGSKSWADRQQGANT